MKIDILCVADKSNYFKCPGQDINLWTVKEDAYLCTGGNPIIAHPPCQQWSRNRSLAKSNEKERLLAFHCWGLVNTYGGIFEHPAGSSFFKTVNADFSKIISVNQFWFGFPCQKRTYLYFHNCSPLAFPLRLDAVQLTLDKLNYRYRSIMPLSFCQWLIDCVQLTTIKAAF